MVAINTSVLKGVQQIMGDFAEATEADANGFPLSPVSVALTSDVDDLNNFASGGTGDNSTLRFVRFEVLFDIDALQQGLTPSNPIPSTKHLRIPFQY